MMSWGSSSGSCSRITSLLEQEDCNLIDIIKDENFKVALKKQVPHLLDFLVNHIGEITDLALGVTQSSFAGAQEVCFSLIVIQMHALTSRLVINPEFLTKLNTFISGPDELTTTSAAVFSRILQFIIQASNCAVLDRFPERESLFGKLLRHIKFSSVTDLLVFMTEDRRKGMITFLEDNNITDVLLQSICDDPLVNEKIFLFMANVVSFVEFDSVLLSPFERPETMTMIFDMAMNSCPHVSSKVFNLLFEVAAQCDSEEEDPLYVTVFKFLLAKVPEICDFVLRDTPFLEVKTSAMELINMVVIPPSELPQCVVDLCEKLFDMVFTNPANTFLHSAFLSLFDTITMDPARATELVEKAQMRKKIVEAYKKKGEVFASYWGMLYTLATKISSKFDNEEQTDEEWREFVADTLEHTKEVIDRDYGGPVPGESDVGDEEDLEFPIGKSQSAKKKT